MSATASRPAKVRQSILQHLPDRDDLFFALYASLGSLLALWLAMWLQLDAPYWAGSTVLITAQISRAQSLLKGVNRLVGTVAGTVVGVALIGLFPQSWSGFLASHTVWVAICTFVSCLLRSQQSYAAALSGYTALIVAVDSFGMPQDAFETAVSRGSSVFMGVGIFVTATRVLTPRRDIPITRRKLTALIEDGLALMDRLRAGTADACDLARFLPGLAKLDDLLEDGTTAAPWLRGRKPALRGAMLALVDGLMQATTAEGPGAHAVAVARGGLALLRREGAPTAVQRVRRSLDRNVLAASLGAWRVLLGMGSACVIWVATRWPSGADFVLVVGILCGLFASRPSPVVGTRRFVIATMGTAAVALWIGFFVLPDVSGFGALALVLFPFLFIGALGVRSQRYGAFFTPLNFFLMTMADIRNQMTYNPLDFFNSVEALVLGSIYACLWFVVLPPLDEAAMTARLRRLLAGTGRADLRSPRRRLVAIQRLGELLPRLPSDEACRLVAQVARRWPPAEEATIPGH